MGLLPSKSSCNHLNANMLNMLPKHKHSAESLKFNYKGAAEPSLSFESEKYYLKKQKQKLIKTKLPIQTYQYLSIPLNEL